MQVHSWLACKSGVHATEWGSGLYWPYEGRNKSSVIGGDGDTVLMRMFRMADWPIVVQSQLGTFLNLQLMRL